MISGAPSTPAVAHALERNSIEGCRAWTAWRRLDVQAEPDHVRMVSDVPFPTFNGVLAANLAEDDPGAVERVLSFFRRRRIPMAWWTGPGTSPGLDRRLARAGLSLADDLRGMAVELDAVSEPPRVEGLEVAEVSGRPALADWADVVAPVYGFPPFARDAWLDMHAALAPGVWTHLVGRVGGDAASAVSVFVAAGVAGIANVAVRSRYRRRGIAAATVHAALSASARRGLGVGVLWASKMGVGVYRALGFRTCGRGRCWLGTFA